MIRHAPKKVMVFGVGPILTPQKNTYDESPAAIVRFARRGGSGVVQLMGLE